MNRTSWILILNENSFHIFQKKYFANHKANFEHKFKHSFQDSLDPIHRCGTDIESFLHFFLHFLYFKTKDLSSWALLRILIVNCWTIVICAQHKFFSLTIHRWILILTNPFLTQPSALLYPYLKNHFFKSHFLPEFILYPFSLYTDIFRTLCLFFLSFFSLFFGLTQAL